MLLRLVSATPLTALPSYVRVNRPRASLEPRDGGLVYGSLRPRGVLSAHRPVR